MAVGTVSNLVTTFLGAPIASVLYGVVSGAADGLLAALRAPDWLRGINVAVWYTHNTSPGTIALQLLLTLPVFFLLSWWIEYRVTRRMLQDVERTRVSRAVLVGNALSYLLLAIAMGVFAAFA